MPATKADIRALREHQEINSFINKLGIRNLTTELQ
jgi:hypothetical protein